jgi:tRNA 2-thiouridine synthesizing protein E
MGLNTVEIGGKSIQLTESGFLICRGDWSCELAEWLASQEAIVLETEHWELIRFIQDYYRQYNHLPNARLFVKAVSKVLGEEKGNSRYLHRLFPDGPVKQVCKFAGLSKPPGCL